MMDDRWRSPLAHRAPLHAGDEARLRERPHRGLFILRGEAEVIGEVFTGMTGLALPRRCRQTVAGEGLAVLWLSPDEWLLVTAGGAPAGLGDALDGLHHQLVDVSDYETVVEVGGTRLRELLAKTIALDLHPAHLERGEVLATRLAKAVIKLWLVADERDEGGPSAWVFVRRSHADYVWCLLAEAGREWGLPAQAPVGRVPLHVPA